MSAMENHFRTVAFGGFCKQDVLSYITESEKRRQKQLADLNRQVQQVSEQREESERQLQQAQKESQQAGEQLARLQEEQDGCARELEQTRQALAELEQQYAQAGARLEEMEARLPQLEQDAKAFAALKERTATIELEAHRQAQETVTQAEEEAQGLLAQANAQAEQTVAQAQEQAERQAAQLLEQANVQATQTVEQAEAHSAQVRCEMDQWVRKMEGSYQTLRADLKRSLSQLGQQLENSRQMLEQAEPTFQGHDQALAALMEHFPACEEGEPYV